MSEYQYVNQPKGTLPPIITPYRPGVTAPGASRSVDLLAGTTRIDDTAALRQAGNGALELAGSLNSSSRLADDTTGTASSALSDASWGGSLGTAVSQTLDTWHQQSGFLVRTCRDIHGKCTATADNYTRTEAINTQNVSTVQQQTSPFG